jgi:hypothetical protein
MTMANRLPTRLSAISSSTKGNFCTVVVMIFLPLCKNFLRSPERSATPTMLPYRAKR